MRTVLPQAMELLEPPPRRRERTLRLASRFRESSFRLRRPRKQEAAIRPRNPNRLAPLEARSHRRAGALRTWSRTLSKDGAARVSRCRFDRSVPNQHRAG